MKPGHCESTAFCRPILLRYGRRAISSSDVGKVCTSALTGETNVIQSFSPVSVTGPSVFSLGRRCLSTRRFLTNLVAHDPHLHRVARGSPGTSCASLGELGQSC